MESGEYIVRVTPLKEKVHKIGEGVRVSQDALEIIQDQLDQLAEAIIKRALENCYKSNRKTIMESDVKVAFESLIHPHIALDESIEVLEDCINKLEESKENGFGKYLGV